MTFEETTKFLYEQVPVFQHAGASAYKPGLANTLALDHIFGSPHQAFRTIHVGGTNGKGSTSHTLAAILQLAGYKVGLYTSPHLVDFRERIRVNGAMISKQYVVDFVADNFDAVKHITPSFFELTMMMAFNYFREQQVDVAIIEVGLGGRLDSTNIINPDLSIITNISFDHVQFLGDTIEKIASEKAGIIKRNIPVVIGEATNETKSIFKAHASALNAPIFFAEDMDTLTSAVLSDTNGWLYDSSDYGSFLGELGGDCQIKNTCTILTALPVLIRQGYDIPDTAIIEGFKNVTSLTGLQGRWQKISDIPLTFCDTGHNEGGISYIANHLKQQKCRNLRIVIGMVNDKDIRRVMSLLPPNAIYYFTRANVQRALAADELCRIANEYGLTGECFDSVEDAYNKAIEESNQDDFVFIGGSNFIVADLLSYLQTQ